MFHKHHFDIQWFHIYIYLKNKAGAINGTMERSFGKKKNYKYHFYYEYMLRFHNRVYRCDKTLKYGKYEMNQLEDILNQFKCVCKDFLTPPPAPNYYRPNDLIIMEIKDLGTFDALLDYILNNCEFFAFDFEFNSMFGNIEIAQISKYNYELKKIENYIIYFRKLVLIDSQCVYKFIELFLTERIKKLGFGCSLDMENLSKEVPYTLKRDWDDFLSNKSSIIVNYTAIFCQLHF
jgi:hypothetical protein